MLTLRRKGNCREDAVLTKSYLNISIADPSALGPVTPEEAQMLARLDLARLPRHVAVIMDGNGRWAERKHLPRAAGHRSGTMPRGARQVLALRPASVAIHDDRHMPRQPRQVQPGQHLRLFRRDRPESARVGYGYVEIRFRQHRVFPTIPFTPQS